MTQIELNLNELFIFSFNYYLKSNNKFSDFESNYIYDLVFKYIVQDKNIFSNIKSFLIKYEIDFDNQDILLFNDNKKIISNQKTIILSLLKLNETNSFSENNLYIYNHLIKQKFFLTIVKHIKDFLRKSYFAFQTKHNSKLNKLLVDVEGNFDYILSTHSSTYERKSFYDEFYSKINEFIDLNKITTIIDIACGMNPISYTHFNLDNKCIILNELMSKDCEDLNKVMIHFKTKHDLNFQIIRGDILNQINELNFALKKMGQKQADVCFLLKILDTLETKEFNITKHLLSKISTKYFVVSFSTKTLSGKKIYSNREWFEKLIENKTYNKFEIFNELIYIIEN